MRRFPIPPLFLGLSLVVIILGSLLLPTGLPAAIAQGLGETETPTPTFTETATLTETATATLTVTETAIPTLTPTVTDTTPISATASLTVTPTATFTSTPTETATVTPTATEAASPTVTPTIVHQQFLPVVMQRWDSGFQPGWRCWGDKSVPDYCRRALDAAVAISASNVWAVGEEGVILHWEGSRWRQADSPVQTALKAVAAAATDDVWAVGEGGVILHFDGDRWRNWSSPTRADLLAVAVVSTGDAWAIGAEDTILHWDGSSWRSVPCPTDLPLRSLSMRLANDGWIAGGLNDRAVLLHWDGQTWTKATLPDGTYQLNAVAMVSDHDGWAMGGYMESNYRTDSYYRIMLRWNGQAWTIFDRTNTCCAIGAITMISATDGWAIGGPAVKGGVLHWDGFSWTSSAYPDGAYSPGAIVMISASEGWAVGTSIVHWDGHGWSLVTGTGFITRGLNAISVVSSSDAWAVGYVPSDYGEDAITAHWDGQAWTPGSSPGHYRPYRVTMLSADEGWASADSSNDGRRLMLHWTGTTWTPVEIPYGRDIQTSIGGIAVISASDAWAVGSRPSGGGAGAWVADTLILHWDGNVWREVDSRPNGNLLSVSMITPDDGWAVGFQVIGFQTSDAHTVSLILHWDGHSWESVPSPVNTTLRAIAMKASIDGWIAAGGWSEPSQMLHWDGLNWTEVPSPQGVYVSNIAIVSSREAWAGGSGFTSSAPGNGLLHWDGESWKQASFSGPVQAMSISGQSGWIIGGRFAGLMRYAGSRDQLP
ncbi:MAG: hypothetical protein U0822_08190 [Anaerolineae bacterium]